MVSLFINKERFLPDYHFSNFTFKFRFTSDYAGLFVKHKIQVKDYYTFFPSIFWVNQNKSHSVSFFFFFFLVAVVGSTVFLILLKCWANFHKSKNHVVFWKCWCVLLEELGLHSLRIINLTKKILQYGCVEDWEGRERKEIS